VINITEKYRAGRKIKGAFGDNYKFKLRAQVKSLLRRLKDVSRQRW
jgi:hypothetical protein